MLATPTSGRQGRNALPLRPLAQYSGNDHTCPFSSCTGHCGSGSARRTYPPGGRMKKATVIRLLLLAAVVGGLLVLPTLGPVRQAAERFQCWIRALGVWGLVILA